MKLYWFHHHGFKLIREQLTALYFTTVYVTENIVYA